MGAERGALEAAAAALDRALAARPARDDDAFIAATDALCRARAELVAESRRGGGPERLGRLNAILSIALAGHFPIGSTPWAEVEQARTALRELATSA